MMLLCFQCTVFCKQNTEKNKGENLEKGEKELENKNKNLQNWNQKGN